MKKLLICLLCLGLVGCATRSGFRNTNRENINRLYIGMTKDEVLEIMGTDTKTVYPYPTLVNIFTFGMSAVQSERISNPYKTEVFEGEDGKNLEVLYYYTDLQRQDGAITDDELTPVILENSKVIGWGRSFLDRNIDKHELRIR